MVPPRAYAGAKDGSSSSAVCIASLTAGKRESERDGALGGLTSAVVGLELLLRGSRANIAVHEAGLGESEEDLRPRVRLRGLLEGGPQLVDVREVLVVAGREGAQLGDERRLGPRGDHGGHHGESDGERAHDSMLGVRLQRVNLNCAGPICFAILRSRSPAMLNVHPRTPRIAGSLGPRLARNLTQHIDQIFAPYT